MLQHFGVYRQLMGQHCGHPYTNQWKALLSSQTLLAVSARMLLLFLRLSLELLQPVALQLP